MLLLQVKKGYTNNGALNIKLNSYAQAILDKYKDQYLPGDLALPVITNQRMNTYLKEICKLCDINEPIRITGFKNGRRYDIVRPKYSEMSTHAGRKCCTRKSRHGGVEKD